MFITTKAKFEWDKELGKYVEVSTEGYEYEGELALADNHDDPEAVGTVSSGGLIPDPEAVGTVSDLPGADFFAQYAAKVQAGIDSEKDYAKANLGGSFRTYGEEDLFTKISEPMRAATTKGQYDSFFKLQTAGMDATYVDQIGQIGYTKSGKAQGFAGSGDSSSVMDQLQIQYAKDVAGVEGEITSKMSAARKDIRAITQQNQSTSLQLKQLAEADSGGGKK